MKKLQLLFKSKISKIILGIVSSVVIILVSLAIIKPEIQLNSLKSEVSDYDNLIINAKSQYPEFKFKKSHQIEFINNQKHTGIKYQSKSKDFQEGKNIIKTKRIKNLFFFILKSKDSKNIVINVDRIVPEFTVISEIPKAVFMKDNIEIEIKSEKGARFLVNGKEQTQLTQEQVKLSVKLANGDNKFNFSVIDANGNESEEKELVFYALVKPTWENFKCGNLRLGISDRLQRGYALNSFSGDSFLAKDKEAQAFLRASQKGICKTDEVSLDLEPKGAKAGCYYCDGNSYYLGISGRNDKNYKTFRQYDSKNDKYIKETKDYTTKFGITGKIKRYEFPKRDMMIYIDSAHTGWAFDFDKNGMHYRIWIDEYKSSKNAKQDFNTLLDSFVFEG